MIIISKRKYIFSQMTNKNDDIVKIVPRAKKVNPYKD